MEFKQVDFDVNEIAPDAPEGEWTATIPRGKCKVQPTKEDKFPMLIVPFRLDKTEEEGEAYEKALGTELSTMVVFFDNTKPKAARMSKLRLRQLCEAADIDLDVIPKKIHDPINDLEPLVRALEGKKLQLWTKLTLRKDTGETVTEVQFFNPKALPTNADADDDEEEEETDRSAARGRGTPAKKSARGR
jgi:hypothetical protein